MKKPTIKDKLQKAMQIDELKKAYMREQARYAKALSEADTAKQKISRDTPGVHQDWEENRKAIKKLNKTAPTRAIPNPEIEKTKDMTHANMARKGHLDAANNDRYRAPGKATTKAVTGSYGFAERPQSKALRGLTNLKAALPRSGGGVTAKGTQKLSLFDAILYRSGQMNTN